MQQLIDAPSDSGPLIFWQVEVAAQVEQRLLFDGAANAHVVHQTISAVRLAAQAVTGLGAANEHVLMAPEEGAFKSGQHKMLWHYIWQ